MVMGHCDLEVVLDQPDRTYRPGDRVTGFVNVTVNKDCTCRGLHVQLGWKTHGRGNRTGEELPSEVVFEGEWKAGEQHLHVFEFTVPDGPLTYHGTYLNVDWAVRAWADIPWAFDPKGEVDFLVHPPEVPRPLSLGPRFTLGDSASGPGASAWGQTLFGMVFMLFTIPFFFLGFSTLLAEGVGSGLTVLLLPTVFVLVGAWMVVSAWKLQVAEMKLGEVQMEVEPRQAEPGHPVEVHLRFTPRADVPVNAIVATLRCDEVCVSGSGTNKSTHTHPVFLDQREMLEDQRLEKGRPQDLSATFRLPDDAPSSFRAQDNELRWVVAVAVDVPGWPDWERTVKLGVQRWG